MPHLDRNGVQIYYDDRGSGVPLLLSHGYTSTGQMWDGQIAAFVAQLRVITWDMRGHGRSDSPADVNSYSEELTVADMAAILDACEIESALIGGLSLGGYMSLAFYRQHRERTRALLLFDTGPGYRNDEARDAWNRNAEKRARDLETRGLEALNQSPEVAASRHRGAEGLALAARGMLAQRDARIMEVLAQVEVPTLVLAGADDKPFLAATDYMAAKIPNSEKVLIADAGHASNIDQPQAFNEAVLDFLRRQALADSMPGARS